MLPTHDHPEGEELAKKYTPINPCAQTVPSRLSYRTKLTFWSKFIGQTSILIFLMVVNLPLGSRIKELETNLSLRVLMGASVTKLEESSLSVFGL